MFEILLSTYIVKYPVSYGAMCIHEEEYECRALCPLHAYVQFINDTKDEDHYSARENRTLLTYNVWANDISKKES